MRDSLQRVIQQRQDQPPQYFFSFDSLHTTIQSVPSIVKGDLKLLDCGLNKEMKMELYATGKNSLLMRIENIADVFDSDGEVIS